MGDLSSPTRDRTHGPCSGSAESQPLDPQGSPSPSCLTGSTDLSLHRNTTPLPRLPGPTWLVLCSFSNQIPRHPSLRSLHPRRVTSSLVPHKGPAASCHGAVTHAVPSVWNAVPSTLQLRDSFSPFRPQPKAVSPGSFPDARSEDSAWEV